jgi:cysteine desulfurase/selenocysteine lyase
MNTNNFDNPIGNDVNAISGYLPDVELLTRMANELFSASSSTVTATEVHSPVTLPELEIPTFTADHAYAKSLLSSSPATIPLPFEAELRALSVPAQNATTTSAVNPPRPTLGSSFYFLEEATSLGRAGREPQFVNGHSAFDVNAIKRDFPILKELVNGRPLIWLDNAATTQKPQAVISRLAHFYQHENSNIHRAAHELAARATDAYEASRQKVKHFLNTSSVDEIIFVRGTTEGINLVAQSWGRQNISEGDEIVISWLEHHANIVPWQQLCNEKGAKLRVAPVDDDGQILLDEYQKLLSSRTKLVAFSQVSNALGTVTPARKMIEMAHQVGARVLVDGAQSVSHMKVDVQQLGCDWFVFSGHKVFGPTGIGALFGKAELLDSMPPWQGGGNMIRDVTFEKTTYHGAPARFEAGTGNIADAVGLGAAIDYVQRIGIDNINRYEHQLMTYATRGLNTVPGLRLIGTAAEKAGVLSFTLKGFTSEQVGEALNREGIAVRSGHHCAQPILRRFGLETTVRPSLALYNTCADIDVLVSTLHHIQKKHDSF